MVRSALRPAHVPGEVLRLVAQPLAIAIAAALGLSAAACTSLPGATAGARRPTTHLLTLDTHVDIPRTYMRESRFDPGTDTELRVDLGKMARGGLDAAFFVIFVEQGPRTPEGYAAAYAAAERKVSAIEAMVAKYPDRIRLATSPKDVVDNHAAGRLSAMMGIENGFVIGKDLARLDALYARGARYIGLTHTGHNDICTSSGVLEEFGDTRAPENDGLSAFGEGVVRRANRLGMLVDVSHSSDACVRDVLRASSAPIIASHSAVRALTPHARNLDDDLLRAIAAKGGVIHVVAYSGFLKLDPARDAAVKALEAKVARDAGDPAFDSAKHEYLAAYQEGLKTIDQQYPLATLDDYLDHLEHAVKVAGIDHVGLASDFDGGGALRGWADAGETRNVTAGLRRRGFTDAQIAQLWSGNLLRTWRDVEQSARTAKIADQRSIDAIFDAVMNEYHLPGMALGVVEDGQVVYTRTAGELVSGGGQKVDGDSLFKIASNTKAMTTGLLARLVDAGKLAWDDPVVKYLPKFRMSEPWITREMRVRDLLIHNSGLREGAGDLMLWPEPNHFTRADIIAGLQHLKPVGSFRSHYDYDNLMYIVAGEVAAAAGGASYEELVRREVFDTVGLTRCQVGEFDRERVGNVAQPHMWEGDRNLAFNGDEKIVPAISSAAAGGIRCSLTDMLTWMRMWLDPDLVPPGGSTPWLTREQHEALWTPQTPMPMSPRQKRWNNGSFSAYGYGWRLSDVDGVRRVSHTGTLGGMYSALTLLPEKRSGFVFMINGEGSRARTVLNEALVKRFTAPGRAAPARWYIDQLNAADQAAASTLPHMRLPMRKLATASSVKPWLGRYRDPWFGEVSLCERDGHVRFDAMKSPLMTGDLMQVGDRLLVDWDDVSVDMEPWLTFTPASVGRPVTLTLAKVDPEGDFSSDYEDLLFTRVGTCAAAKSVAPLSDAEASARVDRLMHAYTGDVPGASVLVLREGKPALERAYGLADLEQRTRATPTTNYRLASVTKQFTATAILLLAEDGRLRLDDPIRQWLPELPEATQPVTIRHLLSHTGGLIDYEDFVADDAPQVHDADVLALLAKQNRVYFAAGSNYRYSNSGYSLLSLVVAKASGRRFADFLRERIFEKLGMRNTLAFEDGISTVTQRAFGYSAERGAWTRADQSSTSAVLGDGGVYSSIEDLARWDAALYDDRLLRKPSRDLAFAPTTHTDNPSIDYGFGWRITGETLWHSGETRGFRNVIIRYPERRLTVIVLTNRNDPEPYATALAIARLYLPGAARR
ncbi:MAG TPA: serine hydrolase [Steroidobacteraceae bacterium]|nr:serine hydrolase [Steroidobacteraceae bacterium]